MLFGGSGTSANSFSDLQILDRQEMVWLDVTQNEANLDPRSGGNSTSVLHEYDTDESPTFRMFGCENAGMHWYSNPQHRYAGGPQQNDEGLFVGRAYSDDAPPSHRHPGRGVVNPGYSSSRADWRARDMAGQIRHAAAGVRSMHVSPNPNDEDTVPTVLIHGRGPGRRAGHTATAVNRKIYVFGGSCGTFQTKSKVLCGRRNYCLTDISFY